MDEDLPALEGRLADDPLARQKAPRHILALGVGMAGEEGEAPILLRGVEGANLGPHIVCQQGDDPTRKLRHAALHPESLVETGDALRDPALPVALRHRGHDRGDVPGVHEDPGRRTHAVLVERGVEGHVCPPPRGELHHQGEIRHTALVEDAPAAAAGRHRVVEQPVELRPDEPVAGPPDLGDSRGVDVGDDAIAADGEKGVDARLDEAAQIGRLPGEQGLLLLCYLHQVLGFFLVADVFAEEPPGNDGQDSQVDGDLKKPGPDVDVAGCEELYEVPNRGEGCKAHRRQSDTRRGVH